MKKIPSLLIVIPAFNEINNFKDLFLKLRKNYNLLVIDDGSSDGTNKFLIKNKINFIKNKKNLGYEKSLIKAFLYISKLKNIKLILTMDADGQHKTEYIKKIVYFLKKKNMDLVIGSRIKKNRFLEILISFLFKNKFTLKDPLSGFKLYTIKIFKKINLNEVKNLFLVDLVVKCIKKNFLVTNFDILTKPRIDKPRVGNFLKSNLKMLRILIYLIFINKK